MRPRWDLRPGIYRQERRKIPGLIQRRNYDAAAWHDEIQGRNMNDQCVVERGRTWDAVTRFRPIERQGDNANRPRLNAIIPILTAASPFLETRQRRLGK